MLSAVVNLNKTGITLDGDGAGATNVQVSGTGDRFYYYGERRHDAGLRDREDRQDRRAEHHLSRRHNVTVKNNTIHGQFVIGDGEVSRAIIVNAGGLLASTSRTTPSMLFVSRRTLAVATTGTVKNNTVYGTKGWVLEGGDLTFTDNTWGTGEVTSIDIAISPLSVAA